MHCYLSACSAEVADGGVSRRAVLVVGNGTSSLLHSILFPSVSKAVARNRGLPVVVVGPSSVQHSGAGERTGKVEAWDGGCALQVRAVQLRLGTLR